MRWWFVGLAGLFSLLSALLFWLTSIPLGIPGEWSWGRIEYPEAERFAFWLHTGFAFLIGGAYYGFVMWGGRKISTESKKTRALFLAGLTGFGFMWLMVVQSVAPVHLGSAKGAWVLYSSASSGYFTEATENPAPLSEYLANYENDIQSKDVSRRVLHHGTHPPGLVIGYRMLISICEASPALSDLLDQTQPEPFRDLYHELTLRKPLSETQKKLERSVLWLATLLTTLCGVMVVVPLFVLGRMVSGPRASWLMAATWPLVPALAVFLPKSDVIHAFLGTMFLAVWVTAWKRRSIVPAIAAGLVFWCGMMFSLAILPIAVIAFLWTACEIFRADDRLSTVKSTGLLVSVAAVGFLIPVLTCLGFAEMNLINIWWQNYHNHAEFYEHFQRSYGRWLWVNPLELALSLGMPICVAVLAGVFSRRSETKNPSWSPIIAVVGTWVILWLSGKNRGEAARLWMVIFPMWVWLSAYWSESTDEENPSEVPRAFGVLIVLQFITCWFTVARIAGFSL